MNIQQRVCLVDSDLASLQEMAKIICAAGYSVNVCQTGAEFLRCADSHNAFCVIFNVEMLELDDAALQKILAAAANQLPIVFIANSPMALTGIQAMKPGAIDFLIKPPEPRRLLRAINEAARKYHYAMEIESVLHKFDLLTEVEQEVFALLVAGLSNNQIAAELGLAEKRVMENLNRMMRKMSVHSVDELIRISENLAKVGCLTPLPLHNPEGTTNPSEENRFHLGTA